jgi:hypothetical protein
VAYFADVITDRRYSDHLDMLLALISYLALTQWRSRSPNALAAELFLPEERIVSVPDGFPGLFRKNPGLHPTAVGGQPSYTLHARYARRRPREINSAVPGLPKAASELVASSAPDPAQDGTGEELDADFLRMLLDFVSDQARAERESTQSRLAQRWLLLGVVVAAAASIVAAIIQAVR